MKNQGKDSRNHSILQDSAIIYFWPSILKKLLRNNAVTLPISHL